MKEKLPPIFVINLPRDDKRRRDMSARLDQVGLPYEFIEAVDGKAMAPEYQALYDRTRRMRYFGRDLKLGELGCTFSHYKIFKKMDAENIEHAVILEDDAIFEKEFEQVLSALMDTSVPWDVIRFLGSKKIYKRGCRKITPLVGRYSLARLPTTPGGAHGYLLSLKAARAMIKYMQRTWMPIDAQQGRMWETGLETLVVHPAPLFPEPDNVSTIGDERMDKTLEITGVQRALFPFCRAWFKVSEQVGKKYVYWGSALKDKSRRS